MSWKTNFLSKDEQGRIEQKVQQIRDKYQIELSICIAKASSSYSASVLRNAFFICVCFTFFFSYYFQLRNEYFISVFVIAFFLAGIGLSELKKIKANIISLGEISKKLRSKSLQSFFLLNKSDKPKIMFYFSLLEKETRLLTSTDLVEKIPESLLIEIKDIIRDRFKTKSFYQGIKESLVSLETYFESHFDKLEEVSEDNTYFIQWVNFS
jgi:uncharacterized membrane protein